MLCNSSDCYKVHKWKKEQRKKMLKLHELVHMEMQFLDGLTLEWCVKLWRLWQKFASEGTNTTSPFSEKFMSETGMMCKCSGCYKVVHKWRNKKMSTDVPWRSVMQMQFLMCFWNLYTSIHSCGQSLHRKSDQYGFPLLVATTLNWIGGDCTILLDAQEEEEEEEESARQLLHNSTIQSVVGDYDWNKLFFATNRVEVLKNSRKFAILVSLAFVASTLNRPNPKVVQFSSEDDEEEYEEIVVSVNCWNSEIQTVFGSLLLKHSRLQKTNNLKVSKNLRSFQLGFGDPSPNFLEFSSLKTMRKKTKDSFWAWILVVFWSMLVGDNWSVIRRT
jgi:hypothetical protein